MLDLAGAAEEQPEAFESDGRGGSTQRLAELSLEPSGNARA